MFGRVYTAAAIGIDGIIVSVEADVGDGLPSFDMVGYLGAEVKEARERVRTALKNSGFYIPPGRITVSLSPADLRKQGNYFDISIALAILSASGLVKIEEAQNKLFVGELGLNGSIRPINGTLALADCARRSGITDIFVPKGNAAEASSLGSMNVYAAESLSELVRALLDEQELERIKAPAYSAKPSKNVSKLDFSDISGQSLMKRAATVAAAGMHNLLFIGPPGSGKSMSAKRIPTILTPMSLDEQIEVTKIYSISGLLHDGNGLIAERPFRSPHHTISPMALAGGGSIPKPGEVSLAHNGILFLDELAEFKRESLEIMRQPIEEHEVTICRVHGTYVYPARFMLVAAMNCCPCGYYPDMKRCRCSPSEIRRYMGRISRPLLDRIDICVHAPAVNYSDLLHSSKQESSESMRAKAACALERQKKRYEDENINFNSQLNTRQLKHFCSLNPSLESMLGDIFEKLGLSVRAKDRILKVARTIADIEGSENIEEVHLAEAVNYRCIDQKLF